MARFGRLNELSHLENVIEQKKREIQEKQEALKKKETEDALKKIQEKSAEPPRRPFWQRGRSGKAHEKPVESAVPSTMANVFSNDGSFLEQFRQLSKSGLKPDKIDVETLAKAREADEKEKERKRNVEEEKRQRQLEREVKEREREFRHAWRMNNTHKQENTSRMIGLPEEQPSKDTSMKMNIPPPGVVQLVHQLPAMPPMVIAPVTQLVLSPPPPSPSFTTNQIQLQAAGLTLPPMNLPPMNALPIRQYYNTPQPPHVNVIPTPQPMAPQSIPSPKPLQVEAIPPPPWPQSVEDIPSPPKRRKKETISTCQPPPMDFEIPLPDSIPLPKVPPANGSSQKPVSRTLPESVRHLAKMVADSGDAAQEILRVSHADDPTLRFLNEPNSADYCEFRRCVELYRKGDLVDSDAGSKANSDSEKYDPADVDDYSSESDNPDQSATRVKKLHKKGNDKYDPADCDTDSTDSFSPPSSKFFDQIKREKTAESVEEKNYKPLLGEELSNFSTKSDRKSLDNLDDFVDRPSFQGASKSQIDGKESVVSFVKATSEIEVKRKRKSRWGHEAGSDLPPIVMVAPTTLGGAAVPAPPPQLPPGVVPANPLPGTSVMLSQVTRRDPGLVAYAQKNFGSSNLSEEEWKKAEDHYKINLLYQIMLKKREEIDKLSRSGKFKYEYDSDEETEGGTWEHKLRNQEMQATQMWADELTRQSEGKHHIGDFLPPNELKRFMEKYDSVKTGREPDLSDYKEFKLMETNVGYQLLQKMGWTEGQGLGPQNQGIINPVNKASSRLDNQGLGADMPDSLDAGDDEYDAYRKRMMLAYRFRPNPLNNPRRPYY